MKKLLFVAIMAVAGTTAMAQTQQAVQEKTVYIIDGKVAHKDAFDKLAPEKIKNISVLKGIEQAVVVSTKESANLQNDADLRGKVVEVKSVKISDPNGAVKGYWKADDPGLDTAKVKSVTIVSKTSDGELKSEKKVDDGSIVVMVRGDKMKEGDKDYPLIIVKDAKGEISIAKSMSEIKPETIKAITVRKDSKAAEYSKYGNTTHGVIVIELL